MNRQPTRPPLSVRKKLLFAAVACLLLLVALEGVARLVASPETAGVYDEHRRIITVAGLPALNEALEYDPLLFWTLKPDVRDLHVAGAIGEHRLDFRLNTNGRLRSPPPSPQKPAYRVLVIGDSCAFGVGVEDDECWPARLRQRFEAAGESVEVINAGVPGYTAYQGRVYLETEGLALSPDIVVACFGFNDRDTWASRSDHETAQRLAHVAGDSLLSRSRLLTLIRSALRGDDGGAAAENAPQRPRLSLAEFHDALRGIKQLCDRAGAKLVLLVWPFGPQVELRVRDLEPYQAAVIAVGAAENVPVVNLVDAFIDAQQAGLFVDHIHASPAGCRLVAEEVNAVLHAHQAKVDR